MAQRLPLATYLTRVALPFAGVFGAGILLVLAIVATIFDLGSTAARLVVFTTGLLFCLAGVGWGMFVNAKPLPARA